MERKKRSKGSVWEFCYANKIFATFGFEMRACGQKLVKFCTLTHIHTHTHTTAAKLVVRISNILAIVQHYCGFIAILQTSHLHVKRYEIDLSKVYY